MVPESDPRITAYVFDELSPEERANFERELHASEQLSSAVRETRQVLGLLTDELGVEPHVLLSESQRDSVAKAISGNTEPRAGGFWTTSRFWTVTAAAASLTVVAGLSFLTVSRAKLARYMLAERDASTIQNGRQLAATREQARRESSHKIAPLYLQDSIQYNLGNATTELSSLTDGSVRYRRANNEGESRGTVIRGEFDSDSESEPNDHPDPDFGGGPGLGGDQFSHIVENDFREVVNAPLSTFSIDVDTASYSKVRMYLMQNHTLPRPDAVRIEELINYFTYHYQPPLDEVPFAAHVEVASCVWQPTHRLVRIAIKGKEVALDRRPNSNLVFLLDVSGSMNEPNKLPLLKRGMKMLVDQLGENDRVAVVVYAGAAGLVLDSTTGDHKQVIVDSLERLNAGGSTNGGDGIQLAYQTALDHFVPGGVNRVILCTDGDFNVGTTGTDQLVRLAETNARTGVFLSVLGFGMGNHNDAMLEQISNKGNGNYAYIDTDSEARKVLVEQLSGTLITIAKDVKIQIEFNPLQVGAYRLIGYENRVLAAEDFNDDKKDAGEIGAGHTVTALYEVVPAGQASATNPPSVDDLKYQRRGQATDAADSDELLTLKIRYKEPDGDTSRLLSFPVRDEKLGFGQASQDFRFASAVASFGMLLRNSQYKGNATYASVQEIAKESVGDDVGGYRAEFLQLIERAMSLGGGR